MESLKTVSENPVMSNVEAEWLARARASIETEQESLRATASSLDHRFSAVLRAVLDTIENNRKLILTGIGKSAHVARKITGTFNSIGAPASFLDATQALHGDLGLCRPGDLCFLLSNSGESEELLRLLPLLKRFELATVAFTSRPDSELARQCNHLLVYVVPKEACSLNLAPTSSTTAAMALGDALAMVLLDIKKLSRDDFARFHPAGNLGRVLLMKVADIMRTGERMSLKPDTVTVQEAILEMTRARSGCIALTDGTGKLSGILTDGDFRRAALARPDFLQRPVSEFMTRKPVTVAVGALAADALRIFQQSRVDDLIAVDPEDRPVGLVDGQDLPRLHLV